MSMPTALPPIVLPAALPGPTLAEALRQPSAAAQLPLEALVERLSRLEVQAHGTLDTRQATPLEAWCTEHGGWQDSRQVALAQLPLVSNAAGRWVLELQHLRLSAQGIQNLGTEPLALSPAEDQQWREASVDVLAEHGWQAQPIKDHPGRWQLLPLNTAPDWLSAWDACSAERTLGAEVDRLLPRGKASQPGRALLNALQMHWHAHPLNEARHKASRPELNGAWLWGSSSPEANRPLPAVDRALQHWHDAGEPAGWVQHWVNRPPPQQPTLLILLGQTRWVRVVDRPAASPWQAGRWLAQWRARRAGLSGLLAWWHDEPRPEPT